MKIFTKKVKQEIADSISTAFSELFPGKKLSGILEFPNASHDIMVGYDRNENVTPDIWIDFVFTHGEIEERAYGTFEKIKEVGSVPVYKIIVTDYNDFERRDFFDTIYHEVRHAWQGYNGYALSDHDAEGYANIMTTRNESI
jgi:hypothetical protein